MNNHGVETCRKKVATEATQHNKKTQKTSSYACHICGLNGHKMIDCPKFIEMEKMFCGNSMIVVGVQPVVEIKIVTIDVNVVDVNVTTRNKAIEEYVFKYKESRKANSAIDWEKGWLKKSMVEIIQKIQKTQIQT
jgi:hypothetical protein